jgi:hypothetical protein
LQHITNRFFNQLVLPLMVWLPELTKEFQADFGCRKFFTETHVLLSIFAHLSKAEATNDLAEQLNDNTLATAEMVGYTHGKLATSSLSRANANRPYQIWQSLFTKLYAKLNPKFKRLHLGGLADLNEVRLVDGSLFAATTQMLWASYRSDKNKLKGHFFMDLNGLPERLIVSNGKASERAALLGALVARVTYVFDRGYNSYGLFAKITAKQAYFVTRLLGNASYELLQNLNVTAQDHYLGVLSDQLILLPTDEEGKTQRLRLVTYQTNQGEIYRYLTNRLDLPTLSIVRLYLWRWEIELLFAWLKRHLVFNHWYSENENGVRIQLFAGLICYLLLRLYAATLGEEKVRVKLVRQVHHHLTEPVSQAQLNEYQQALLSIHNLEFCYTFSAIVQRN